jgi:hypothetical protein
MAVHCHCIGQPNIIVWVSQQLLHAVADLWASFVPLVSAGHRWHDCPRDRFPAQRDTEDIILRLDLELQSLLSDADPSPSSSAEVKNRVELYLYSP